MWQRFTESARRVVFFAQEEAGRLGESYVSSEHLLLGIIRENDGVAARILDRMGVSRGRIRSEIERQITRGDGRAFPCSRSVSYWCCADWRHLDWLVIPGSGKSSRDAMIMPNDRQCAHCRLPLPGAICVISSASCRGGGDDGTKRRRHREFPGELRRPSWKRGRKRFLPLARTLGFAT